MDTRCDTLHKETQLNKPSVVHVFISVLDLFLDYDLNSKNDSKLEINSVVWL